MTQNRAQKRQEMDGRPNRQITSRRTCKNVEGQEKKISLEEL